MTRVDLNPYAIEIANGHRFLINIGRLIGNPPMNNSGHGVTGGGSAACMQTVRDLPTLTVTLEQKDAAEAMAGMLNMVTPVLRYIGGPSGAGTFCITAIDCQTYLALIDAFEEARKAI